MLKIARRSLLIVCAAGVCAAAISARQELPEGQGKDVTMRLCGVECHGIDKVISEHRSKSQWIESIETMKQDGMKISDAEFKAVLSYLIAHFGVTVKINQATARQIDDVLDLEPGQAEAIVKYREANGPFADWKALLAVPGLDAKKLEEQKGNVIF
ncbi:MAG: helix-hairpin-helix domain-containing protein [Acidobacteria bacterium]|nr:MAG: helix-hairpin-helix domain-containing protein [Acidobacteriota bacterium]